MINKPETDVFEDWSNLHEVKIYNEVIEIMEEAKIDFNEDEALLLDLNEDWDKLLSFIDSGFQYISELLIFFPKINCLMEPTHNFEFHFYTNEKSLLNIIKGFINKKYRKLLIYNPREFM